MYSFLWANYWPMTGSYQVDKRVVVNKRDINQIHDLSVYAADLYTNCDDDISNVVL